MFLRWMVRSNEKGVDFGIWNKIDISELSIPLFEFSEFEILINKVLL